MATAFAQAPTPGDYLILAGPPVVMIDIARCESNTRQFDESGGVLRGAVNPQDVGLFQINERYWLAKSKELGFDIYTPRGNIAMALWLYKTRGTKDWGASKGCWGKMGESAPDRV